MEDDNETNRVRTYISIREQSLDRIEADLKRTGLKQVRYLTQVVEWFADQNEDVRDAILSGNTSRADAALAKALQARVVEGDALSFDDAANAVKKLLATMQAQHAAHVQELKDAQPNPKKRKG